MAGDTGWRSLIGGAIAGLVSDGVMHPVDTVRTRLWCSTTSKTVQAAGGTEFVYKNFLDGLMQMIRTEGSAALYKGFSAVAAFTTIGHALYFTGYEGGKSIISLAGLEGNALGHLGAGLAANCIGGLAWTPMDVIKQRMQVRVEKVLPNPEPGAVAKKINRGLPSEIFRIIQAEGYRGLFKGYVAGVATFGPFSAVYFMVYEELKKQWLQKSQSRELPFIPAMACGASAGACGALVSGPMDLIKTRTQVFVSESGGSVYASIPQAIKTVMKEEGAKAFTKGLGARVLWISPGCAITIATYELFKQWSR